MELSVIHCLNCSGIIEGNGFAFCDPNCFDEFMIRNSPKWKSIFRKQDRKIKKLTTKPT